jgi:hypothetical protein
MRASINNAMPEAGVDALISFMRHFEQTASIHKSTTPELKTTGA